jgi:hypothetical protein
MSEYEEGKASDLAADDIVRRVVRRRDVDPRVVLEMEQTESVRSAKISARPGRAGGGVSEVLVVCGEPSGIRTLDPLIKSQVLYQLS